MRNLLYAIFFVIISKASLANEVIVYYPQPVTISQTLVQTIQPTVYQVWVPMNVYYEQRLMYQNQYWIIQPNAIPVHPLPVQHRCRLFNY
jgi:hypothetical protein